MTTAIDLTEEEAAELRQATNQTDLTSALRVAAAEYLRYVRRMRLKDLSGKVQMQENWGDLEKAEEEPPHGADGPGAD